MLLAELVAASDSIAATPSRTNKISILADLLSALEADEIVPAVGFLTGVPRQGKIGIGWSSISSLQFEPAEEATLTIALTDETFSVIQSTLGAGSVGQRAAIMTDFLGMATEGEADFIRRLLTGELRQGALAGIMADAIAKASGMLVELVRRAAMLSGDLGETARLALLTGEEGLREVGLQVLRPVQPMLASTAEDVGLALEQTGLSSVEWKLDGIRIQVHRADDEIRVFTRNLNDITDRTPDIVEVAKQVQSRRFVLDGEAISTGPWFFDVIHFDGADLIDRPLRHRMEMLEAVASAWRVPALVTDDAAEAQRFLEGALDAGHEGVVVKGIDSLYQAGRRGKTWRKIKKAKTFDLVVLGAEWGNGRRKGWLSNLHLGARTDDGEFVMVGKTFKGMTDEMLRWQTDRFLELETERSGITVFVRPEIVVEIALDGVQTSSRYPGGVALRFARVLRYRDDKSPEEADTLQTLKEIVSD
ncbi:MAG: ATP-dependent DNA ligase [Actinobacteria bacterium]|nr:ATP-dependent DNA ligase [Actinomycetota bacterium]